jgi:hypothetical protein
MPEDVRICWGLIGPAIDGHATNVDLLKLGPLENAVQMFVIQKLD